MENAGPVPTGEKSPPNSHSRYMVDSTAFGLKFFSNLSFVDMGLFWGIVALFSILLMGDT